MSVGVFLGGDTVSRGVVRTSRAEAGDIATLGVFGAGAVAVLTMWGASMWSAVSAAGIAAVGLGVCLPWQFIRDATGGTSLRGWLGVRIGFRWRRAHGLTSFNPTAKTPVPAGVESLTTTDELIDDQLIAVTELSRSVDLQGKGRAFITVLEVQGDPEHRGPEGTRWSALLEFLGTEASLASHITTVASVTDWDATDHVWLTRQDLEQAGDVNPLLVESYGEVIDRVLEVAAARRTWVALRFPVTPALRESGDDEESLRRRVADQTMAVADRAETLGLRMRPLDSVGQAALCRHLMDPEVSPDDVRGLGEGADCWLGAFPAFRTSKDRRSLVVDGAAGQRWMTTWEVPAWTIEAAWLPVDWLYPLSTALSGQVHRVITVTCELVETRKARAAARADVTSDSAAVARQETVSDGTNEVQAIASRTRLEDLAPGRQTVGVNWSMAVAFHSRSEKEHITFDRRMMGALADSYIGTPLRLRYRQDAALGLIMPITRAGTKTRIERMTEWVGL